MLNKVYKKLEQDNGIVTIYGSNRPIKVLTNTRRNDYFKYRGKRYYFGEFMSTRFDPNYPSKWIKEFDGYLNDSFFSGVLIKMSDDRETVKAYTFIS